MVQQLVEHAQVSSAPRETAEHTFQRILVPVDMSEDAQFALEAALALQGTFHSEVQVVTLTEFGENEEFDRSVGAEIDDDHVEASALGRLRRFVENVAPGALDRVECRAVEDNDVPGGIDRCAIEWDATLVVLATHRTPSLFRTQVERTMKALDVPVLLLKRPAH